MVVIVSRRCLGLTDGLQRGAEIADTGAPVMMPTGSETLGRIFNLLGEAIDNGPQVSADCPQPDPPRRAEIEDLVPEDEVFVTALKSRLDDSISKG